MACRAGNRSDARIQGTFTGGNVTLRPNRGAVFAPIPAHDRVQGT